MGNTFVNTFAALEPAAGRDDFRIQQKPRKPTSFFEGQVGVNRLFRANLAFVPESQENEETPEAASFVVDQFLKRPKMA